MDGIEADVGDRALVVRADIQSAGGAEVARRYGATFTPTFVVFDGGGTERARTSQPGAAAAALRSLLTTP